MANTYTLIASNTLGSSAASVTFSSIPNTFTDLVLRASIRTSRVATFDLMNLTFNGDTATNYSVTWISGNGSAASSANYSSQQFAEIAGLDAASNTANTFSSTEIYIPSYTVSQNKPLSVFSAIEDNATAARMYGYADLWRNTAAITSLTLTNATSSNFVSGSSFFLYGIKNS